MCRKLVCSLSFVLTFGLVLTSAAAAGDPDLVGWWKFEEASGTLYDQSDNHNDATSFDGVLYQQTGRTGYALGFDGIDDRVVVGTTGRPTDTFSFGCWLKTSVTHEIDPESIAGVGGVAGQRYVFDPQHGGETEGGAGLSVGTNGILVYEHGSNYMPATAVYEAEVGTDWNHIMIVYDNKQPTIYLNGSAVRTGLTSPRAVVNAPIQIGGMAYGFVEGLIDEVRIYSRALSPGEVKKMAGRVQAFKPDPADGAVYPETWASLGWTAGAYAVSHDVYLSDNFDDVSSGTPGAPGFRGNQSSTAFIVGFLGFPYPDGLVPGTTYYWRVDEVNDSEPNSPWRGDVWSFSIPPKTAYDPDPADGAEFVDPNVELGWTPGFGAKLHYIHFGDNFDDVNNATAGTPSGVASYDPGTLEREKVLYWRIDEYDGIETYKGDIWAFTTPGAVGNPQPANGAVDVQMNATLSWTAADNAASHELYFGTDAVRNATTASPEYVGPKALGAVSYDPGGLAWDSSYAWRVDEVYPTGAVKGLVWSFTTTDFIGVDDFESYNDIDPPDAASNRIFDKWLDGFGTTTNGALVGNDLPPYAEQTIVNSGAQSMGYRYDNNLKTSEATLTLVYPRDWTAEGVTKLSLWFRGASANSAERMFISLDGNIVVYHDDANATQVAGWTEWVIDLTRFAGADLTNVSTITIGIGTKNSPAAGGSGQMYCDDIRLYRQSQQEEPSR
ncbi:MAG: LamG domain-containing protein [Phycisphaerae bacterium]|nr:LamG domain-containing protein [Phycisphaerae bacterium]